MKRAKQRTSVTTTMPETTSESLGLVLIDDMTPAHRELYFECCELNRFIEAAYPENATVRRIFRMALFDDVDNAGGSLPLLQRAYSLFWKLSETERRRIMNGWKPVKKSECQSLAEVIDTNGGIVKPAMRISTAHGENANAFGQMILSDAAGGTEFYVHIGTSKHEVIRELRAIIDFVTLYFDAAIVNEDEANKAANSRAAAEKATLDLANQDVPKRGEAKCK